MALRAQPIDLCCFKCDYCQIDGEVIIASVILNHERRIFNNRSGFPVIHPLGGLPTISGGVLARTNKGMLVGAVFFIIDDDEFYDGGTHVHSKYQRRGIGALLWDKAFEWFRIPRILLCANSDRGYTLALSLQARYPEKISIDNYGARKLRDLRRGGQNVHSGVVRSRKCRLDQ